MDFVDAVSRASEHPETFRLPDTSTLEAGDAVCICNGRKRFWVKLTSVEGEELAGRVVNYNYKSEYVHDVVIFERRNVYDVCRDEGEVLYPSCELYLPEELFDVEDCASRHKIPGPLADIAHKMLELWRDDGRAAMRYAKVVLTGPMPEPMTEACREAVQALSDFPVGRERFWNLPIEGGLVLNG